MNSFSRIITLLRKEKGITQIVIGFPNHGIMGIVGVADGMEQIMTLELGGVLAICTVQHQPPFAAEGGQAERSQRCGMAGSGGGADHGLIGYGILAALVGGINGDRVPRPVDFNGIGQNRCRRGKDSPCQKSQNQ